MEDWQLMSVLLMSLVHMNILTHGHRPDRSLKWDLDTQMHSHNYTKKAWEGFIDTFIIPGSTVNCQSQA